VSLLSDIAALKTRVITVERRTTAVEAKNAAQGNSRASLDSRATNLQKEVDALKYIISPTPEDVEPSATVTYGAVTTANPNNYADGAVVAGAGIGVTTLTGKLDYGSSQEFRDMTIDATGDECIHNKNGASGTTFRRVRFRGGRAGAPDGDFATVAFGGENLSCDHITFIDCEVERNLGLGDNIGLVEDGSLINGTHVSDVTFTGCHVGVSNGNGGHDTGGPRMGVELYTYPDGSNGECYHGWSNFVFTDCVFEATDDLCFDLADGPSKYGGRASGPATMTRCTFMGGGYSGTQTNSASVAVEGCKDVTFTDCLFYRGREETFGIGFSSGVSTGLTVTGCTFDLTYDNGITQTGDEYNNENVIGGDDTTFTNNTIHNGAGGTMMGIIQATNSNVENNTFHDTRASNPPWAMAYGSSTNLQIWNNTFQSNSASELVLWNAGSCVNVTLYNNVFTHA
jgi:hypothetical protein